MSLGVCSSLSDYPSTPCQWRDFYCMSGMAVIPHYETGVLYYRKIIRARVPSPYNKDWVPRPNFHGETVSLILTTISGKEIGIVFTNGLMELGPVKHPILQVDNNDPIGNQRWVKE